MNTKLRLDGQGRVAWLHRSPVRPLLNAMIGASVIACWGCTTIAGSRAAANATLAADDDNNPRLFQIYIDSNGRLLDPTNKAPIAMAGDGTGKSEATLEERYVKDILAHYKRKNGAELVIFIHGGLAEFASATGRAAKYKDAMLAAGKYPLFISWDSGLFGNYADHLFVIRRGDRHPVLAALSFPFVLAEDIARSIVRIPASYYNITLSHRFDEKEEDAVNRSLRVIQAAGKIELHLPSQDEGRSAERIRTYTDPLWWNPFKLVVAPIIEGAGPGSWHSMLRRTDLVIRKRKDDDYLDEGVPGTAASRFFELWEREYGKPEVALEKREKVVLVGHSMGSIIANNIIAKYQETNFARIVYMGAACRVKDLEHVVAPYLLRNPQSHFYNLSLHPKREESEKIYYDFAPRGTLLAWIDQSLGDIHSLQDRPAGSWKNIARSGPSVFDDQALAKRVHFTLFGVSKPGPVTHGSFDDFRFWSQKFWERQDCSTIEDLSEVQCSVPKAGAVPAAARSQDSRAP